jgi:hypothetical protein
MIVLGPVLLLMSTSSGSTRSSAEGKESGEFVGNPSYRCSGASSSSIIVGLACIVVMNRFIVSGSLLACLLRLAPFWTKRMGRLIGASVVPASSLWLLGSKAIADSSSESCFDCLPSVHTRSIANPPHLRPSSWQVPQRGRWRSQNLHRRRHV